MWGREGGAGREIENRKVERGRDTDGEEEEERERERGGTKHEQHNAIINPVKIIAVTPVLTHPLIKRLSIR